MAWFSRGRLVGGGWFLHTLLRLSHSSASFHTLLRLFTLFFVSSHSSSSFTLYCVFSHFLRVDVVWEEKADEEDGRHERRPDPCHPPKEQRHILAEEFGRRVGSGSFGACLEILLHFHVGVSEEKPRDDHESVEPEIASARHLGSLKEKREEMGREVDKKRERKKNKIEQKNEQKKKPERERG